MVGGLIPLDLSNSSTVVSLPGFPVGHERTEAGWDSFA